MKRAVPTPESFGQIDQAAHTYFESQKDTLVPKDFEAVSAVPDTATLAELITAHNALVGILKG